MMMMIRDDEDDDECTTSDRGPADFVYLVSNNLKVVVLVDRPRIEKYSNKLI